MKQKSIPFLSFLTIVAASLFLFPSSARAKPASTDELMTIANLSSGIRPAFWPALAINNRDELMVIFTKDEEGGEIYSTVSKDGGETWTDPFDTSSVSSNAKALDVVGDSEGNFHMVYSDGVSSSLREIYYRYYENGVWQPREQISDSVGNANWSHIDVEGDTVYIAWYEELGGGKRSVIHMKQKEIGGVWPVQPENVSQDPSNGHLYPDIKVKNGDIYTVFQIHLYSGSSVVGRVIAFKEKRGGVWKPTAVFSPRAWPDIEVDSYENVHVLYPNEGLVLYRHKANGSWSSATNIGMRKGVPGFFDMDSRDGVLIAVYTSVTSNDSKYWSVHYRVKKFEEGTWGAWGDEVEVEPESYPDLVKVILDSEGFAHIVWVREYKIRYAKFKVGGPDAPFIRLSENSLDFRAPQGESAETQVLKIKNSGPGTLNFQSSADNWIIATPFSGTVGYDWMNILVNVDTNQEVGTHEDSLTFTSDEATNSPQSVKVTLTVDPPPVSEPLNFSVESKENRAGFFRELIHVLKWEPNPLNEDIIKYLITCERENGEVLPTRKFEVDGSTTEYLIRQITSGIKYSYSIQAVDNNNRVGPAAVFVIEE